MSTIEPVTPVGLRAQAAVLIAQAQGLENTVVTDIKTDVVTLRTRQRQLVKDVEHWFVILGGGTVTGLGIAGTAGNGWVKLGTILAGAFTSLIGHTHGKS